MKREVIYFEKAGPENTKACIDIVKRILGEGYKNIVVATTSGETGLLFAKEFSGKGVNPVRGRPAEGTATTALGRSASNGVNLIVITHSAGFKGPNQNELDPDKKEEIIKAGAKIYTGTILTHSIETGLAQKFSGSYPTLLIAQTLRRLGEGVKVCCEIVMEGCDAGLLPEGEPIIAIAGTGSGADTVCILKGAVSKRFLDLKVMEILAKPKDW